MDASNFIEVGFYKEKFNELTGAAFPIGKIYCSRGLSRHLIARKHGKYLKYLDRLDEIIDTPDYVGHNPNESDDFSIELIKRLEDIVLIGLKFDKKENYIYVSTIYGVQESKISRRLNSGRIKEFSKIVDKDD